MEGENGLHEENEMLLFLDQEDIKYGKNSNQDITENQSHQSLGQAKTATVDSTISGSNDGYWKRVPLENLPSTGLFYAEDTELTIRAASVSEIRQWSTIDESDILDIDDKLNFILEKCVRLKLSGGRSWLTWRDVLEVDRLYIVFLIYEITFANGQNELYAKFECTGSCSEDGGFKDSLQIKSSMLQIFDLPSEIMTWYSPQYRCFEVVSDKLNETFYLYMPTVGVIERLRKRISEVKSKGRQVDKAFVKVVPYLIQDWSKLGTTDYANLQSDSFGWHINKFTFITKFSELLKNSRETSVTALCPKCGSKLTAPIFSQYSFTIKDLFLISGRLDELV
jgi:hypothetical protein